MARDPGGVAPGAVASPQAARLAAFYQRRLRDTRRVEELVNAGKLHPQQGQEILRRKGYLPGGAKTVEPHGPLGAAAKAIGAVTQGAVDLATKPVHDVQKANQSAEAARRTLGRRPTLKEATGLGLAGAGTVGAGGGAGLAQVALDLAGRASYGPAGIVEAVKHPGRTLGKAAHDVVHDPLTTAMAVALLSHGVGQGASRLAGASSALRAGEGAKAAAARPGHAGGSLLHTPEPGTFRLYKPGGHPEPSGPLPKQPPAKGAIQYDRPAGPVPAESVDRLLSRNVLVRKGLQEPRNRYLQKRLNEGPAPTLPTGRIARAVAGGARKTFSADATFGREVRAQRRVEGSLKQAPVQMQQRAVHTTFGMADLSPAEAEALRVVAIKGTAAIRDPETAVRQMVATHERLIGQGEDAAAHQEIIHDLGGALKVLKAHDPRFMRVVAETSSVSNRTGGQLEARGYVTPEERQRRLGSIASIYHDDPAAHGLLAERAGLEKQLGDAAAPANVDRSIRKTQAQLQRNTAEQARYATRPRSAERAAGGPAKGEGPDATLAKLRTEESGLRSRLDELAQHKRVAEVDQHLQALAPEGAFFFSQHRRYTENPTRVSSNANYTSRPGEPGGVGPIQPSRLAPGIGHRFSGQSVEQGLRPTSVADTVADYATRVNRLTDAEDFYGKLWRVSTPQRRTETQIPIRADSSIKSDLRLFFKKLEERAHARPGITENLDANELKTLTDKFSADVKAGIGESLDGVRWVEPALIKNLGEVSVTSPLERAFDAFTNPIRTVSLYGRPAYALNAVGNVGMAAITQGVSGFPAGYRTVLSRRLVGPEDTNLIDAGTGASHSRSYLVDKGAGAKQARQLAEAWNALTDLWFRRASFYHEAARAGFTTPAQLRSLLRDDPLSAKRVEVFRRANKNAVDFASLTPAEQTARHYVYFYAWLSRGSLWALRTLVEHPGKSFTLLELGKIGEESVDKKVGVMPQWFKDLGAFPVGQQHGETVRTINPSSIYTPSTLAQAGEAAVGTAKALARGVIGLKQQKGAGLGDVITPGVQLFTQAAGGGGDTGATGGVLGLPQVQALKRGALDVVSPGIADELGGPSKTYPDRGLAPGAAPLAIGGLYARQTSVSSLNKQGRQEQLAKLTPTRKASFLIREDHDNLIADARKVGLLDPAEKVPAELDDIFRKREARAVAYAKAGATTERERFIADIDLLERYGAVDRQAAAQARAGVGKMTDARVEQLRRRITAKFFGGDALSSVRGRVKRATEAQSPPK